MEKMYNDFKKQHEEQMDSLREALRRERLAFGTTLEEQVRKVEIDSESLWTAKIQQKQIELDQSYVFLVFVVVVPAFPPLTCYS